MGYIKDGQLVKSVRPQKNQVVTDRFGVRYKVDFVGLKFADLTALDGSGRKAKCIFTQLIPTAEFIHDSGN